MKDKAPWIYKPDKPPQGSRTNNDNRAIYNKMPWRNTSKEYKIRNPKCKMCGKLQPDYKKLVCDHIIPIEQGGSIWDERNFQTLCAHPCHDRKSGRDQKKYKGPFTLLPNGKKIPI